MTFFLFIIAHFNYKSALRVVISMCLSHFSSLINFLYTKGGSARTEEICLNYYTFASLTNGINLWAYLVFSLVRRKKH